MVFSLLRNIVFSVKRKGKVSPSLGLECNTKMLEPSVLFRQSCSWLVVLWCMPPCIGQIEGWMTSCYGLLQSIMWCGSIIESQIASLAILLWNCWRSLRRTTATFFVHMCGDVRLLSLNHNYRMIRNFQNGIDVLGLGNFWVTRTNTCLLWRMCVTYQPVMFLLNFMSSLIIFLR